MRRKKPLPEEIVKPKADIKIRHAGRQIKVQGRAA